MSRFPGWKDLIPNKTERLATTDLDSFVKRELISQIDFIKLDIEGAELEVFKGAKKTLQGSLGISTEAVFYPWRKGMPNGWDLSTGFSGLLWVLCRQIWDTSKKKMLIPAI